jgi:hypothetical protein
MRRAMLQEMGAAAVRVKAANSNRPNVMTVAEAEAKKRKAEEQAAAKVMAEAAKAAKEKPANAAKVKKDEETKKVFYNKLHWIYRIVLLSLEPLAGELKYASVVWSAAGGAGGGQGDGGGKVGGEGGGQGKGRGRQEPQSGGEARWRRGGEVRRRRGRHGLTLDSNWDGSMSKTQRAWRLMLT